MNNIPYLDAKTYYRLQSILQRTNLPIFYNCNLLDILKFTQKSYDIALFSNIYHYLSLSVEDYQEFLNKISCPEILALYTWILNREEKNKFINNGFEVYDIPGVLHQQDYIIKLHRKKQ